MWISTTTSMGSMCSLSTLDEFQRTIYFTSSFRKCAIRLPLRIGYPTYYLPRQSVYLRNFNKIIFTLQNFMAHGPLSWCQGNLNRSFAESDKNTPQALQCTETDFLPQIYVKCISFVSHIIHKHDKVWTKQHIRSKKRKLVCFLSKLPDIMCKVQLERIRQSPTGWLEDWVLQ
jgi:hypothetical protein